MDLSQLTERQRDVYNWIASYAVEHGYGPTIREVGKHFGIKSPNGVMCHLSALEKKGAIKRGLRLSRTIQVVGDKPVCSRCGRADRKNVTIKKRAIFAGVNADVLVGYEVTETWIEEVQ